MLCAFVCVSLGLKKPGDFTVSEGHGYPLVYLYNRLGFVLGGSSFPSIHLSRGPSIQVPHPKRRWNERRRTTHAAAARPHTKLGQRDFRKIYPNVWRRDKEDDAPVRRSNNGCKREDAGREKCMAGTCTATTSIAVGRPSFLACSSLSLSWLAATRTAFPTFHAGRSAS
jgi:hypothetical protein